jgi:uncharacterized protein (DUF1501 family)
MSHPTESRFPLDRRQLLAAGSALGGAAWLAQVSRALPLESPRTLLVLQLAGGNDGLSMVVPHGDDRYHSLRPGLRHEASSVLALDGYRGFHPALTRLRKRYEAGQLALVEGAGYPEPVRSHFRSFDIWHAADPRGRAVSEGWVGRLCGAGLAQEANPNLIVHVGGTPPYALHSSKYPPVAFVTPAGYRWAGDASEREALEGAGMENPERESARPASAGAGNLELLRKTLRDSQASSAAVRRAVARYQTPVEYPREGLGQVLRDVAALVHGELGTRVLSAELGGFDTHADQKNRHDQLMRQLDAALGAFLEDMERSELGRNVVVLVFSEFGRRVKENGSRGTDHGVAGPMLVLGSAVKGGLFGKHPSLSELDDGDLIHTIDFRAVYGALIEGWFGVPHERVLGRRFEPPKLV